MGSQEPEDLVREVIETCAGCDFCGFYLEKAPCLVFPELYRLHRKERMGSRKATRSELWNLVGLCNGCAMCPCEIIRSGIRKAKTAYILRDGLDLHVRFLERVELAGKFCGTFPTLNNIILKNPSTAKIIKRILRIHDGRHLPTAPKENFSKWLVRKGRHFTPDRVRRKVAYFVGCTGNYLFPEVPKAVVKILARNGIELFIPGQKCCGMPPFLEGDRALSSKLVAQNVKSLYGLVEDGWDIVCSCPTCGYMLKNLWKDEHCFGSISRRERVKIALKTFDIGEYLLGLHKKGEFNTDFAPMKAEVLYYPPCHLREQNIGEPYPALLKEVSQLKIKKLENGFFCCGMAGIMGYKREFYDASTKIGDNLMRRIRELEPESILTDCLSCKIQFRQFLSYPVLHPVEILERSSPCIHSS